MTCPRSHRQQMAEKNLNPGLVEFVPHPTPTPHPKLLWAPAVNWEVGGDENANLLRGENPALPAQSLSTETCVLCAFENFLKKSWKNGVNVNNPVKGGHKKGYRESRVWFSSAAHPLHQRIWFTALGREKRKKGASRWERAYNYQSMANSGEMHRWGRIFLRSLNDTSPFGHLKRPQ